MSVKKILITGGAGFIGHHLAKRFRAEGMDVVIFDALLNFSSFVGNSYEDSLNKRLQKLAMGTLFVNGDVRDRQAVEKAVREHLPDVVIHLAAIPVSKTANVCSEEAVQININGTANLLESIRAVGMVKRFVFVSTSFVYGDFKRTPADEEHPLNPIDIYGATKLSGEILTKGFASRFGIDYAIVRPSAVYGCGDSNHRVVQIMVENALAGRPLVMHNGGGSCLDFTYIDDAVSGIVLAGLHPDARGETFNITRGEGRSIRDLVAILREKFSHLTVTDCGQDERRPERGGLDISKAIRLLGYKPQYSLEDGIEKYINSMLESARSNS